MAGQRCAGVLRKSCRRQQQEFFKKNTAAAVTTRYNEQVVFQLLLIGPFSRGGEEVARAALLPWADRGRRRMTHYITSFVEEGSDGT